MRGDMPRPGPDENDRVLLTEHAEGWLRADLPTLDLPALDDVPPTYSQLWRRGQLMPPGSQFTKDTASTAARLRQLGIDVAPVLAKRAPQRDRSPDSWVVGRRITVEFKAIQSGAAIRDEGFRAAGQSRRVVFDARKHRQRPGVFFADALAGLDAGLRQWGGSFTEVLVLGDGWGILWLGR